MTCLLIEQVKTSLQVLTLQYETDKVFFTIFLIPLLFCSEFGNLL